MSESVNGIAFVVLALATAGGAAAMLASRNIVHAAYWLLEVSVAAAGLYYLLAADYIALVQLLIYAGAVAILLIFAIMISLRRREDALRSVDFSLPALLLDSAFFGVVTAAIVGWKPEAVTLPAAMPDLPTLGKQMFSVTGWALPFEIASLVLTAALIAAVWWAREGDE
jgi:NADH-quinone oxidoreductase subunit J